MMRQFLTLCIGLLIIVIQSLIGARAFFPDIFLYRDNQVLEDILSKKKPVLDKLPPEDLAYISNHPLIVAGVDPNFYPLEMFDERGRYSGLGADYIKILSRLTGLEFQPEAQSDWAATEDSARKGTIQILPAAAKTGRRSEYLRFTAPYISLPGILMTRRDSEEKISGIDDLAGKKLAVTKDYAWHDFLREFHPEIVPVPVANTLEAMRLVAKGDAAAVLDYEFNLMEKMQTAGIMQLEKAGEVNSNYGHAIGVRNDQPELFDIISIAMSQINPAEHQQLAEKWLGTGLPREDSRQLQWLFFFFFESILLCLLLNWLVRRKIGLAVKKALMAQKESLAESHT